MNPNRIRISLNLADEQDRQSIYAIRHEVYAHELGQHVENGAGLLTDKLDAVNAYLTAKVDGMVAGLISITPPNEAGYSIDKYFTREELPLNFDAGLYEIRLLTVLREWRGSPIASLLMYGALRYVESLGGHTLVGIGRVDLLDMYKHAGMRSLQRRATSGRLTFELLCATTRDLRENLSRFQNTVEQLKKGVEWNLKGVSFYKEDSCYHGGHFFEAIGEEFDRLQTKDDIVSADVLDAWFDPAPGVLKALSAHLPWALKTSPPTGSEGMQRMLARSRGVHEDNILSGAGSSDLIFLGLRHWLLPESRVLILDPMYGEYAHVLEKIVGCHVDRLTLSREKNFAVEPEELAACLAKKYDWVILVNPNSPTGRHVPREKLEALLRNAPKSTRFWIDETYVEYAGPNQSLERFAAASRNVVICKSMSKVYALSGMRCAYLCGPAHLMDALRPLSPPWAVSLPGQIAACETLRNLPYYHRRWEETRVLREELAEALRGIGWHVIPGCANFLLCQIPAHHPETAVLAEACRNRNLFIRDVKNMGKCFDERTVRIAVKDARTNQTMLEILRITLAEMTEETRMASMAMA